MIALALCIGLLQAPQPPAAPAPPPPAATPVVEGRGSPAFTVPRAEEAATIDGILDEPAWASAARLGGFSEYQPVDSQPASERTEILLWYSPRALHVGIVVYDSVPGSVRATVADRDNIGNDDWVRVYLDTFNDRRRAFVFGVNPLGVQEDGVHTEGGFNAGHMAGMGSMMAGTLDLSPDYQFDSKGRVTPEGYVVEVRIPFKSLRYPSSGPQRWGINVARKTQRTGRQDTWTDAKRVASFLGQVGTMEGLHDLQRGIVTEIQPFITASSNGTRQDDGQFKREDVELGPGVNVRLGFTNVSLDATVNPDFSQVESDATQVTVNERFALYYPEKRPFFLEGIELFATPNQLVYTRRIVDPAGGGKVTGKVGKTGIAFLSAADDTGDGHAWATVARIRQDLGSDSLAGFTFTDRTEADAFNRVAAADARLVFKKLYYVLGQLGGSWTGRDGETRSSPMWQAEFDRTARRWGFNYKVTGFGSDFETQSGYVPRNDIVEAHANNRFTYYGQRGAGIETITAFFGPQRIWTYAGFGSSGAIEGTDALNLMAQLRGGWTLGAWMNRAFVKFDPEQFASYSVVLPGGGAAPYEALPSVTNWGGTYTLTTPVFQRFNASFNVGYGGTPIYAEGSDGQQFRVSASLGLRPTASVRVDGSLASTRISRDVDGSEFARSTIPRLKIEYQPKRSLFFRAVAEYRTESRSALRDPVSGLPVLIEGRPADSTSARGLRMDWLASFEPTPGTVAFFGYGSSLAPGDEINQRSAYRRTSDGFFVKVAYLFRR